MKPEDVDTLKEEWVAKDGSIWTKKTVQIISSFTGKPVKFKNQKDELEVRMRRLAIAFNIGKRTAQHIVKLHNDSLHLSENI